MWQILNSDILLLNTWDVLSSCYHPKLWFNSDSEDGPLAAPEDGTQIMYTISVFTPVQMKFNSGKRGGAKNTFLQFGSKEPWNTFIAQLLVKIDGILNPATITFENYTVTFSVPWVHTKPTDLTNENSYKFMVE